MPEIRHAIEPEEMMAYLDGELPAARAAEAMTHLERCAECQKLAADLRRVSQEMAAWQVEPPRCDGRAGLTGGTAEVDIPEPCSSAGFCDRDGRLVRRGRSNFQCVVEVG